MSNPSTLASNPFQSDTLGIVLAHGKAINACRRHLPHWLAVCDRLVFFTPVDDRLSSPDFVEYSVGKSAAYSPETNLRTREALRFAAFTTYRYVALFEYDSFLLGPVPSEAIASDACAPLCYDPESKKFKGPFFAMFPMLFTRRALWDVVEVMDKLPLDAEGGFTDRYIGHALAQAKLNIHDLRASPENAALVYAKNTIDQKDWPDALKAYAGGAYWTHGVKDAATLDQLTRARQRFLAPLKKAVPARTGSLT